MFCKKCGKIVNTGAKYCKNCGEIVPINQIRSSESQFNKKNKRSYKKLLIGFGILLLIVIIGYITYRYFIVEKNVITRNINNVNCDEQKSINTAKSCTILIENDQSFGSGFSISPGFVVTNRHVVEEATELYTWIDQKKVPLTLWGYSNDADLAIVKIDKEIPQCSLVDSTQIGLAENLYTVGWPNVAEGESSITKGIYSRTIKETEGPEFIQTDAAINPGNSGGPLLNKCGVIGINSAKMTWSDENTPSEGSGFALSSNYIKPLIEFLISSGSPKELPIKVENLKQDAPSQSETTPRTNPSIDGETDTALILINYKLAVDGMENIRDALLNAVYNNPNGVCSSIISSKNTKNHVYYMSLDSYNSIESKYGKYRSTIDYINRNLDGLKGTIQYVKNTCASYGYNIE